MKRKTLTEELEELERTNPAVAAARRELDKLPEKLARYDRHMAARRTVGVRAPKYFRTVDVRCDKCRRVTQITVEARTWQTEDQWDRLVVLQLLELGWRAGQEPKAHHQRAPQDICPNCAILREASPA